AGPNREADAKRRTPPFRLAGTARTREHRNGVQVFAGCRKERPAWEGIMNYARACAALLAAALTVFAATIASAQTYPDRPITMLVAFPPGGADDAIARMLQDPFQRALGQPLVIENIGGAGGMIAAAKAARAEPDGYTILLHQDALAAGMTLYPDHSFDAIKDFQPVGLVNTAATTLSGRPDLPPDNFAD